MMATFNLQKKRMGALSNSTIVYNVASLMQCRLQTANSEFAIKLYQLSLSIERERRASREGEEQRALALLEIRGVSSLGVKITPPPRRLTWTCRRRIYVLGTWCSRKVRRFGETSERLGRSRVVFWRDRTLVRSIV